MVRAVRQPRLPCKGRVHIFNYCAGDMFHPGGGEQAMDSGDRVRKRIGKVPSPGRSSIALEQFRKPLAAYLEGGLECDDKWVRVMAAGMLGALGDPGTAVYLRPLAADTDADVRAAAVAALGQLDTYPGILPASPEVLSCQNCMIRLIAEEALARRERTAR